MKKLINMLLMLVSINTLYGSESDELRNDTDQYEQKEKGISVSHTTLRGHSDMVVSLDWFDSQLASGSVDNTSRIWKPSTQESTFKLQVTNRITSVRWSPDGSQLASASWDKLIRILNPIDGQYKRVLVGSGDRGVPWDRPCSLSWSPDGNRLASGHEEYELIKIWKPTAMNRTCDPRLWCHVNVYRSHHILRGDGGSVKIGWSPNPELLASGNFNRQVKLWNLRTAACIRLYQEHTALISAVRWLKSNLLASASWDETVRIWDTRTDKCAQILKGHSNGIPALSCSPNGIQLASGSLDKTIRISDSRSARCTSVLSNDTNSDAGEVWSLSWSSDGKRLASGHRDGNIKLWELSSLDSHEDD